MRDSPFSEFIVIEPQVRRLLGRAAIDTDEPDQVVRGMLMVTAASIVRLARAQDLDITEAARIASIAGTQLPRLVVQMASREAIRQHGSDETPG